MYIKSDLCSRSIILFAFYCKDSDNIREEYLHYILSLFKSGIFNPTEEFDPSKDLSEDSDKLLNKILSAIYGAAVVDFNIMQDSRAIQAIKDFVKYSQSEEFYQDAIFKSRWSQMHWENAYVMKECYFAGYDPKPLFII